MVRFDPLVSGVFFAGSSQTVRVVLADCPHGPEFSSGVARVLSGVSSGFGGLSAVHGRTVREERFFPWSFW